MAKKDDPIHAELQRDEIAEGVQHTLENLKRNRNQIIAVVVIIVLVAVGWTVYKEHRTSTLRDSNALFVQALQSYGQLVGESDPAKQTEQTEKMLGFLDDLEKTYGGTELATMGFYLRGSAYYSTENYAEAQKAYGEFISKATDKEMQAEGEVALGYAFENESFMQADVTQQRNNLDVALTHYKQAQELSPAPSYIFYYARLAEARIYELTAQNDKAIAIYQEVIEKRPAITETAPEDEDKDDNDKNSMVEAIRAQLTQMEAQLSFEATAKLRLERLQATTTPAE